MIDGTTKIVAGAGAGKTTELVRRVNNLLRDGVPVDRLLVCTFTIAAAEELKDRFAEDDVQVHTLHSFCYDVLQEHAGLLGLSPDFEVYGADDGEAVRKILKREFVGRPNARDEYVAQRLREANAIDYDELLRSATKLLQDEGPAAEAIRDRARYLLVDEAQDLDLTQWMFIDALRPAVLIAVGDPRQSIYQWRGASPADFVGLTGRTEYLTTNHRSQPPIVRLANRVASGFELPDMEAGRSGIGVIETRVEDEEGRELVNRVEGYLAEGYNLRDIAVLGRTWARVYRAARTLVDCGHETRVPAVAKSVWTTDEGIALSRYLRLQLHPHDNNLACLLWQHHEPEVNTVALRVDARVRGVSVYELGVGKGLWPSSGWTADKRRPTWECAQAYLLQAQVAPRVYASVSAMLQSPRLRTLKSFRRWWAFGRGDWRKAENDDRITCTTVHSAKGLEWPCVIVLAADGRTYDVRKEEDRSLLYVAVTRARDRLTLLRDENATWSPYLGFNE